MARPNRERSIGGEANLARRIAHERRQRGWSYENLARRMTDAGCSIQGSALYKIEKVDPPRRVTVDELVALHAVFELSIDDLLTPMEVLEQRRAQELLKEMDEADYGLADAAVRLLAGFADFFELSHCSPELHEYVLGHHLQVKDQSSGSAASSTWDDHLPGVAPGFVGRLLVEFHGQILDQARVVAQHRARQGSQEVGGDHG